jgi:hypothetical protein
MSDITTIRSAKAKRVVPKSKAALVEEAFAVRTVFMLVVNDEPKMVTDDLEVVIREWDRISNETPGTTGGITVQSFRADIMVRDGWVLKAVGGRVWLNPSLVLT